ncbi:MAG: PSD1 domain-containing protein [Planctomycetia bacterium]|nr:PSD1 domain-containing protein [Planctomycetia bacterium]
MEAKPVGVSRLPPAATRAIDYVKDVQPIFAQSCYRCHGPKTQEAGLRLDAKKQALAGADSGAVIIPGGSAESRLIHLVGGLDEDVGRMPPEGEGAALTGEQIALLRGWIDQGAKWPEVAAASAASADAIKLWSLQPIGRPAVPVVKRADWVRNPIDAFIRAELEAEDVAPAPEADRTTLLRRIYLDLLGLPPAPSEVQAFLDDGRPDAYERVVDRLLDSPHYGERWGRHWLDLARYADTDGFEEDRGRPFAWRYRDWVIDALNRDLPFDVFTVQQLAGDLLSPDDREYDPSARIATGFHRNTFLNLEGGADKEEDRVKRTIDRTNTTGTVWLGLTVGCANCHSHKYDPLSQREYFQLYAFFNNLDEVDISVDPDQTLAELPDLTPRQQNMPDSDKDAAKPKGKKKKEPAFEQEVLRREAGALTLAQALRETGQPRTTQVHLRGDFLSPGAEVEPETLACLPKLSPRGARADRLDLARWLFDRANPLVARVAVNRLWQGHFGRGLVNTAGDFGTQGDPPSHPELLDWLAGEFRGGGWHLKRTHRLIVTSATYRQCSAARPDLAARDPDNAWLARQNRLRVEAEIVRDLALAASGLLTTTIGGPSVRPPQPPGIFDLAYAGPTGFAKWEESAGPDRYRRGMYVWFQRISPYPSLICFDAPETNLTCTRRERSNTPLQSLTLLNDVAFLECARELGRKMAVDAKADPSAPDDLVQARVVYAFRECLARPPREDEAEILRQLHDAALSQYRRDPAAARSLLGNAAIDGIDAEQVAACIVLARAVMNLDEFITRE